MRGNAVVTVLVVVALAVAACGSTETVSSSVSSTASVSSPDPLAQPESDTPTASMTPVPAKPLEPESANSEVPAFSVVPSQERVIACRAAEQAFESSPKVLVVKENGTTNRVPTNKEIAAYDKAWHAAMDLDKVEPELQEMSRFFSQRAFLLEAAAAQDPELVKEAAGMNAVAFTTDGERSILDLWNPQLLDDACAAVGSITNF